MKTTENIYLIGPLGAGKSSVGRELARQLDKKFYDTDRLIEERVGVDLSWIFDVEGEDGFRKRELALLKELTQLKNVVISTGGGTILLQESRDLLKENGLVIYLKANLQQQLKRTQRNQYNRPLLLGFELKQRLEELGAEREPLYEEAADISFLTSSKKMQSIVQKIVDYLNSI